MVHKPTYIWGAPSCTYLLNLYNHFIKHQSARSSRNFTTRGAASARPLRPCRRPDGEKPSGQFLGQKNPTEVLVMIFSKKRGEQEYGGTQRAKTKIWWFHPMFFFWANVFFFFFGEHLDQKKAHRIFPILFHLSQSLEFHQALWGFPARHGGTPLSLHGFFV